MDVPTLLHETTPNNMYNIIIYYMNSNFETPISLLNANHNLKHILFLKLCSIQIQTNVILISYNSTSSNWYVLIPPFFGTRDSAMIWVINLWRCTYPNPPPKPYSNIVKFVTQFSEKRIYIYKKNNTNIDNGTYT